MKHLQNWFFVIGIVLIISAAGIAIAVGYFNSQQREVPLVFSNNAMLLETWNAYKKNMLEPTSGRTIDKTQNNLTTSEGESYTMLRAVWMDDKSTFDSSWKFTQNNLQRSDHLFSWKYGKLANGSYGVQTDAGGQNSAADADEDIAMSLLMAYSRWNDNQYLRAAQPIITSIWQNEVIMVQGKPVLAADNLEKNTTTNIVVNPSYFAFADYKLFAKVDITHDWNSLASNSYTILSQVSSAPLDKAKSSGLPPDWITMNRTTGSFTASTAGNLDTNFGYDAIRIPFRLALDYQWFKDPRDKQVMSQFGFLKSFWRNAHVLNAIYAHDGSVVAGYESPAMYGATIAYFDLMDPSDAKTIYRTKLQTLYSPDQQAWKAPAPAYYEDNWAWFGIALTQHALPNLAEGK